MASPVPYSKPKRRIVNKKSVVFKTRKGSFVYAPAVGKLHSAKNGVIITGPSGLQHRLYGVKSGIKSGHVSQGQRIGVATGLKVIYTRFLHKKQIDAMPPIRRTPDNPREVMPGVKFVGSNGEPGVMGPGDERKVIWHTSESGNDSSAIHGVANWVKQQESEYTIIWNPYTGQLLQLIKANKGARAVVNGYTIPANRHGKVAIQVCVIGRADNAPLKQSPMKNRRQLMAWLDSWGVPRKVITNDARSVSEWKKSGHTTHRSAPKPNDHTDPGPINWKRLFAP